MPRITPVSSQEFIRKLKSFGLAGPYQEGKPPYLIKGNITLTMPNPHEGIVSVDLLMRILRQAGIKRSEWIKK